MNKKINTLIVIQLCLLLSGVGLANSIEINFSSESGYETGTLTGQFGWSSTQAYTGSVIESGSGNPLSPVGSDQLVVLVGRPTSGESVNSNITFTDTPITTPFIMDIWMMRDFGSSVNIRRSTMSFTSSDGFTSDGGFVGFNNNKFLYEQKVNDVFVTDETYINNAWYRYHIEVDPILKLYELTIYDLDGNIVVETMEDLGFRFTNNFNEIDYLSFAQSGGSGAGNFYIGGISIQVIPESKIFSLLVALAGVGFLSFVRYKKSNRS